MPSLSAVAGVILSLLADDAWAARIVKNGRARRTVLYTIGGPAVSKDGDLQYPLDGGCFPGIRLVNVESKTGFWKADLVTKAAGLAGFQQPQMQLVELDQNKKQYSKNCGTKNFWWQIPDVGLHSKETYIERMSASSGFLKKVAVVGMANSYEPNATLVSERAEKEGWKLLGSALVGEKVSHLMRQDGYCLLTFEGSDTAGDWGDNANAEPASFCGLPQQVHKGFKEALLRIVEDPVWQSNIRSQFFMCRLVIPTGHSLGGAMATLFSACVANPGSSEFNLMSW